jgi:hypothetical protein
LAYTTEGEIINTGVVLSGGVATTLIPYEPFNPSVLHAALSFQDTKVYWTNFIAPSTVTYSTVTILASGINVSYNSSFSGNMGVGIYDNSSITPVELNSGGGYYIRNIPSTRLGKKDRALLQDIRNEYLEFTLDTPVTLTKNVLYWFALAHDQSPYMYFGWHADYHVYNGQVLEEATGTYSGTMPSSTPATSTLRPSDRVTWFRLS